MLRARQDDAARIERRDKPAVPLGAVDKTNSEEITTTVPSAQSVAQRDLRLDFFRGLALFCMFIDHMPDNIFARFTIQSVMFADAAEVFIFISGYTAGIDRKSKRLNC